MPLNCGEYEEFVGLTARDVRALQKLGRLVKRLRAGRRGRTGRITQVMLADRAGLSRSCVSKIEAGTYRPRLSSLVYICEALAELRPNLGTSDQILRHLMLFADGLIAPESSTVPDRALTKGTVEFGAEARGDSTVPDRVYPVPDWVTQGTVESSGMVMGHGQIGGQP